MGEPTPPLFDIAVWGPVLEKFGTVVQLSTALYGADGQMIHGPVPSTPMVATFAQHGHNSRLVAECVRDCLAQPTENRRPVVVSTSTGLAVVGVSLVFNGQVVGAVVAGFALVRFCDSVAIARLGRETDIPFQELWTTARTLQPVSERRLEQHGELLDVLADTLLRENELRRQSDETSLQFSHLASHDALTDLPNRVLLADRLAHALALARRHQRRVAVLFLDLDRFKHINDSLGHPLGDQLLQVVAREVTRCVRSADTVSRHGGDEFVVVLSEVEHAEDAGQAALKIIAALARPHIVAGHELRITASIGISVFPDDGEDAETLLKHADMALYDAKERGRECYKFFQASLNVRAVERQSIKAGLHTALDRQEFTLVYQPKINLKTGTIAGAEALIRWHHPDRGPLGPAQFVPIAEDCGLIRPIGRWVLYEACRQAQAWQDAGLRPIPVAVNISAVEFRSETFIANVVDVLKETLLDPGYLELELTESVLMTNVTATNGVLRELKSRGVQLAVDDFGTGWSSLSYLRHFPVDALKIDKSFVQEITAGPSGAPIVSAVINMGKSLKYRVIAEGVETPEQLAFLQAEECAEAQGFYFSRPLSAQQFARVLETGTTRSGVDLSPSNGLQLTD